MVIFSKQIALAPECFICGDSVESHDGYFLVPDADCCDGKSLPREFEGHGFTICPQCHAHRHDKLQRIAVHAALVEAAEQWQIEQN